MSSDAQFGDVGYTESQIQALGVITVVSSSFSFVGSAFIIACYLRFPRLRRQSHQIFWLSISDILACIGYFMGSGLQNDDRMGLCKFQGFWIQWFSLASVLWTSCLAYHLYSRVLKHQQDTARLELLFHVFVWPVTLILALLPFATNNYGPAGQICWITSTNKSEADSGTVWRYAVFYAEVWVAMIFNAVVYIQILHYIRKVYAMQGMNDTTTSRELGVINRMKMYPLILLVVWIFPTIHRIELSIDPAHPSFGLAATAALFEPLQGLFNFLVYGFTKNVQNEVAKMFCGRHDTASDLEDDAHMDTSPRSERSASTTCSGDRVRV